MQLVVNITGNGGGGGGAGHERKLYELLKRAGVSCEIVENGTNPGPKTFVNVKLTPSPKSPSSAPSKNDTERLRIELSAKQKEVKNLEDNLSVAMESIKTFHKQQNELFDEFVALRSKYDTLKEKMRKILWEYIPNKVKGFENIPAMTDGIEENEDCVGLWHTGKVLGEGQFAVVKEVRSGPCDGKNLRPENLAVKRILKDKITDIKNALRLNNEVGILRDLTHPNIVKLVQVLHTPNYIYLVQERGGLDLFEYYRKNPGPAKESFAQTVIAQLASAVNYLDRNNISHRDLKPENVLLDSGNGVKLVDFGLSTKHRSGMSLDDFCGTPGFFSPEMLICKQYDSYKLDIWSLGCVLLEILLGHVRFAEVWMPAYAYEQLHDATIFGRELSKCLNAIETIFSKQADRLQDSDPSLLFKNHKAKNACLRALREQRSRSDSCKDFVLAMLKVEPGRRISSEDLVNQSFVNSLVHIPKLSQDDSFSSIGSSKNHPNQGHTNTFANVNPLTPPKPHHHFVDRPAANVVIPHTPVSQNTKRPENHNSSKLTVLTALDGPATQERGRLPPLSPASPKIEGVQELVKIGEALLSKHDLTFQSGAFGGMIQGSSA